MRKLIKLFAFTITFLLTDLLWINVSGQEISTVYEIYNYEIGDVFHFNAWGSAAGSGYGSHTNIEILNKYYSSSGDTLFYSRQVSRVYSDLEGTEYYYYIDTSKVTNLDSLINYGNINAVYSDPALYNNRIINYYEWSNLNSYEEDKWVEGCGRAYKYWYYDILPFDFIEEEIELIYYLKGEEEWGEPFFVKIPEINSNSSTVNIYPNPAKEYLNISVSNFPLNEAEIYIYSTLGKVVNFIKEYNSQNDQINISNLPKGIYIIGIRFQNEFLIDKFIKE
jgi:hypothetical protein